MIEIENVRKIYGKGDAQICALDGIDLTIGDGEFVGVTGESGSGKSTLLRIVGSLERPTSGRVRYNGTDLSDFGARQTAAFRNRTVGFVFQNFLLDDESDLYANLEIPLLIGGVKKEKRRAEIIEGLRAVGLENRIYSYVGDLSGGEKQRVCLARAFLNHPDVILADEPTGNLNSKNGEIVVGYLSAYAAQGHTVILVSHNPRDIAACKRIVRLRDGKVEYDKPTQAR